MLSTSLSSREQFIDVIFTKRFIEFYRNRLEGLCNDFVYWDTVFYILLVDNHVVNSSFVSLLNIVMDLILKT